MKFLQKSTLAAAIATVTYAGAASAAVDLTFEAGSDTVVLASEIFGDEVKNTTTGEGGGTGGNETLIQMEVTSFDLNTAVATLLNDGDNINAGAKSTVKFTLGQDAVFGEDISTTAKLIAANGGAGALRCTAGSPGAVVADSANDAICGLTADNDVTWQVIQGGAIGDNTITIEFTGVGAEQSIGGLTFGNVKVKNLVQTLGDKGNKDSFRGKIEFGVEYVEAAETTADTLTTTATDSPLVILGSQPGLRLAGVKEDFMAPSYIRINVGNGEKTFTGGTADGRSDFVAAGDTSWVKLGTLQLQRQSIDTATFTAAAAGLVKKEFGGDFDFQGGDKHTLTLSASNGAFQSGASVFLADAGTCAAGALTTLASGLIQSQAVVGTAPNTTSLVKLTVSGSTTALTTVYDVCYSVKTGANATNIPEVQQVNASWLVDFFNTRYDDRAYTYSSYGPLLRNGCIASFFNVPGSDLSGKETAFLRLTNTSGTNTGDIRATVYAQDGTTLAQDKTIAPALAMHATQVFTSEADHVTTAAGQKLVSIEKELGLTPDQYKGRARVVLKGAFDTCEGMGLIRDKATGMLLNMTSTTQGNEAAAPNDGNNGN